MIPDHQRDAIAALLSQLVPPDHRFFFIAVPVAQLTKERESTTLENCSNKKQLAQALRICANHYDPQN